MGSSNSILAGDQDLAATEMRDEDEFVRLAAAEHPKATGVSLEYLREYIKKIKTRVYHKTRASS